MDALIRLRVAADGLMAQVDGTLSRHGAAEGHEIWGPLRRGGLLPGDALICAADWLPPVLAGRAAQLRRQSEAQATVSASLAGHAAVSTWEGEAAQAFQARLGKVRAELSNAEDAGAALAECLDELADWLEAARGKLAESVAAALTSAEAVTLSLAPPLTPPGVRAEAAATIGAAILAEVERFWHGGIEIWQRHATRVSPASPAAVDIDAAVDAHLRVEA
jgi:uncharacterized protein YukE